jgi:STE24 endopeptidase
VSQVLILIVYVLWISAAGEELPRGEVNAGRIAIFFGGFGIIALLPALIARCKLRFAVPADFWAAHRHFNWLIVLCRVSILVWFGVNLFYWHDWPNWVGNVLSGTSRWSLVLPGMILGPLPALLAWAALWLAQYPIDQMAREQAMLPLLEANLPVHAPPTFAKFVIFTLRLQVLATVVPLLMIGLLRDVGSVAMLTTGLADPRSPGVATILSVVAAISVLIIAPAALRSILATQRLDSPGLRARLDALCALARTRYRDVLLWRTHFGLGNAAVMGVLPQIRYVLMSDLLLETMTDRQIEAVFAHELGHIVHRHTIWLMLFVMLVLVAITLVDSASLQLMNRFEVDDAWRMATDIVLTIVAFGVAFILFGYFSRRLERQADVYAARAIQHAEETGASGEPRKTAVGPIGAAAIGGALLRAAEINHIPASARSFRHGSIQHRVNFIESIAHDPERTLAFDRSMRAIYTVMTICLVTGGGMIAWLLYLSRGAT